MKCIICGKTIEKRETRFSILVYRGDKPHRKLYACSGCGESEGAFDRLIDALPTNENNHPLSISRVEIEALKLATDPATCED